MADIVNRNKEDVKLSTIIRICENSEIKLENIFASEKREPRETYLVVDGQKYLVELHKVGNTPPEKMQIIDKYIFFMKLRVLLHTRNNVNRRRLT